MKKVLLVTLVVLGLILSFSQGQNPGVVINLTQEGFNYIASAVVPNLESQFQNIAIGSLSGSVGSPIGTINYNLDNINLNSATIGSTAITVSTDGLTISITNVAASLSLNWQYEEASWPHVSDSGSASITTSGTSAVAVATAYSASNGYPQISITSVTVSVGDLNINLSGGASWLYNLFISAFEGDIADAIQSALESALTTSLAAEANQALQTLPLTEVITGQVAINYQLVGNPVFASSYLAIPSAGFFYDDSNPTAPPGEPGPLPACFANNMLQVFVDEYVFNSALYAFYYDNYFTTTLSPSDIPSGFPEALNTTKYCLLVPSLCTEYPDMAMGLGLTSTSPPVFSTSSDNYISIVANGTIEIFVIETNGTWIPAFTLGATIFLNGTVDVVGNNIGGSLSYLSGDFTLISSEIGTVHVGLLQTVIDILFSQGIIPQVNKLIANGFPIPVLDGVALENGSVGYGPNYVWVAADVTWTP